MSHAYSPCSPGFQSSSKRKLSRSMLNDLESLFQADLSKLTIHVDTLPLQYGAAALAGDNSICLAPQYGDFSAASTKAILAHELAHLFQQQTMDVPERAGALLIDPYLELHANTWACLALLDEQSRRHFPHRSDGLRPLGQGAANVMQPWILMAKGTGDNPGMYGHPSYNPPLRYGQHFFRPADVGRGKPYDEKFEQLTCPVSALQQIKTAYQFLFSKSPPPEVYDILLDWMGAVMASGGKVLSKDLGREEFAIRAKYNISGQFRYYHTYGELAWALEREIESKRELALENIVAKLVLSSPQILRLLRKLSMKVAEFLISKRDRFDFNAVAGKPAYGPLHGRRTHGDVVSTLQAAITVKSTSTLIALLHDAKDLFGKGQFIDKQETEFDLLVNGAQTTLNISKYKSRYNVGTPDEADDWVLWMRDRNRPVWAGPSYTMVHMWRMAQAAGATLIEGETLAYAMFAYWNNGYPRTATPVHRFHGVMAAAPSFYIPYNPDANVMNNFREYVERAGFLNDTPDTNTHTLCKL